MFNQFRLFLGPARLRSLFMLLAVTGLISLVLNAFDRQTAPWATIGQSLMSVIALGGAAIIIGGRLGREQKLRGLALLAPAIGAIILAFTVLPDFALPLFGVAAGWVVAGTFLFRPRIPKAYQDAIKHMRQGRYEEAVKAMTDLVKADPQNPDYYRLRAEIFRLWGKLDRARKDYEQMIKIAPESAVGYNGLAEVDLQSGRHDTAREAGLKAYQLAPDEWVAAYNLGMIEDRLHQSEQAVEHLQVALSHRIPDARHRLLIHLYLARAYGRMGDTESTRSQIDMLKRQGSGLEEWQNLLKHDQAALLRTVLADDVQLAQDIVDGNIDPETLGT